MDVALSVDEELGRHEPSMGHLPKRVQENWVKVLECSILRIEKRCSKTVGVGEPQNRCARNI